MVSVWDHLEPSAEPTLTSLSFWPYQEFEKQIKEWCKKAGEDVTYEFAQVSEHTIIKELFLPV